jgi:hypothetical protein
VGKDRLRRRVVAVAILAVALAALVVEPFSSHIVLLSITQTHGIEAGDVPAILLLLVATWLAV